MKRLFALVLSGLFVVTLCSSWGFFAHYRINRLAVFTLPKSMAGFYRANINFITEHAVSADKKRYVDSTEAPHHFFNADHYGKQPFKSVPQRWIDAAAKYSSDTLNKYGTVPWAIQSNYYWLVKAFKARDTMAILISSANLAHYISDAHTPLHLTQNYDGQLTNQQGIHSLWESRLPELFSNIYNYNVGKAKYINNPLAEAFKICRASFKSVDTVLHVERALNKPFPPAQKYTMEQRGNRKVKAYSVAYSRAYHRLLRGMVQRQMRASILSVGSYWFSAWVDAGQPDLDKLILKPLTKEEKQKIDKEETLYKAGKVYTGL
ncbi:zinc dependent phospholipase C family protein [Mucilaginibacter sp. RB4R14]|uniref:zinc dependent phospholipase C family protein n=1 Tax=Mucilaginibacter aurantiaciroseus TaxID=2949308 RepID=UPI0020911AD0|nr:zinc dependent phospholipase C family protein [Mucilaginibacter aurantiaciroseus]MCO5934337.1 zinc dependent phospholipase C family protein [Mucilaginibacter aurantiaciroseus]